MTDTQVTTQATKPKAQRRKPLTTKEIIFCFKFVENGGNGSKAARAAGYSETCCAQEAYRLLRKPHIIAEIERIRAEQSKKLEKTVEDITKQYVRMAWLDPATMYDDKGQLLPIQDMPLDARLALTGHDVCEKRETKKAGEGEEGEEMQVVTTTASVKYADRRQALDSLARTQGMFKDGMALTFKGDPIMALLVEIEGKSLDLVGKR